jgi:hypothetical protein
MFEAYLTKQKNASDVMYDHISILHTGITYSRLNRFWLEFLVSFSDTMRICYYVPTHMYVITVLAQHFNVQPHNFQNGMHTYTASTAQRRSSVKMLNGIKKESFVERIGMLWSWSSRFATVETLALLQASGSAHRVDATS